MGLFRSIQVAGKWQVWENVDEGGENYIAAIADGKATVKQGGQTRATAKQNADRIGQALATAESGTWETDNVLWDDE